MPPRRSSPPCPTTTCSWRTSPTDRASPGPCCTATSPTKLDLFATIYQRAVDRLLAATVLDPNLPLSEQVNAGLDAHIDYFVDNRHTVLAANRVLAGDPVIQAIISEELAILRQRLLDMTGFEGHRRDVVSAVLMSWLVFVRTLSVEWLTNHSFDRAELRDACSGALLGALEAAGIAAPR